MDSLQPSVEEIPIWAPILNNKAMNIQLRITGEGTRQDIAIALRLIASAFDGNGGHNQQVLEDIDGAQWNDCTLQTELLTVQFSSK